MIASTEKMVRKLLKSLVRGTLTEDQVIQGLDKIRVEGYSAGYAEGRAYVIRETHEFLRNL